MQNTKKTIYIADDEENIRVLIKNFLEKNGYEVRAFADGTSLLQEFYEKPCDLVILECRKIVHRMVLQHQQVLTKLH